MSASLRRFVSQVAALQGGSVRKKGAGVELRLPDRDPIRVEATPGDKRVAHDRLQWVEKQAARALLAEPSLFAVTVVADSKAARRPVVLLRVAFGYYIVNGKRCFERYTGYVDPGRGTTATLRGDDRLFARGSRTTEAPVDRTPFERSTPTLLALLRSAQDDFVTTPRAVSEFEAMATRRNNRMFELELLYARRSRHHIRTYGVDPRDAASRPPSATEEYRRRKVGVLRKYLPRVAVCVLSVGIVKTPARRKAGQLIAPFYPEPGDDRWLFEWRQAANDSLAPADA